MDLLYKNEKTQKQCTSLKEARKLFGGNNILAQSLLARINTLENAEVIKDIIVLPPLHFHKLKGNLEGYFAIDVKGRKDLWRIILQPLDEEHKVFDPCRIDEIASSAHVVEIEEVSKHYE